MTTPISDRAVVVTAAREALEDYGFRPGHDDGPGAIATLSRALRALLEAEPVPGYDPEIVERAAASLLETHGATGIDLTQAPEWLALVVAVYPRIVIEGTGPTDEFCQHADTETGRYWLAGDISRRSDHEAHLMRRFGDI